MPDANALDANVLETIQNAVSSEQNINLATNLWNSFVSLMLKLFGDAFALIQQNALVFGLAIVFLIWVLKNWGLDRIEQLDFLPSIVKWLVSFIIIMLAAPLWVPIVGGFISG